jgi:large subunit ribosomal protein L17
MRHRKIGRRLSRTWSHRKAMFRNLVTALLDQEQIITTEAKAKELRRVAERMITLGKRGTPHARRQALSYIRGTRVVSKLFEELAPRYRDRPGGYTRIVKLGPRRGDNAPEAMIELVAREKEKAQKAPPEKAKKKTSAAAAASGKKAKAPAKKEKK